MKIRSQILLPPVPFPTPFFEPSPKSFFSVGGTLLPQHRHSINDNFGIGVVQKLDRQLFQLRAAVRPALFILTVLLAGLSL